MKVNFGKRDVYIKDINFPQSEIPTLRTQTKIITHRVSDDARRFSKGDYVYAEDIDSNYCFEVADIKVVNDVSKSPYISELTKQQISYLKKFNYIAVLTLMKTKYERPYKLSYIKANYPEKVYIKLKSDEVHKWRAETGIELIHLEPDQAEQTRTHKNWQLMPVYLKKASDEKCVELFGVTNEAHYNIVKDEKNISDDPIFKSIVGKYNDTFGFDLSGYKLVSTKTPRYNNGHPAEFPKEQFGGCWTTKGVIYINSDLGPVIKFYKLKNASKTELKKTLIAHELAHGVYRELSDEKFKSRILDSARMEEFWTEYLDHVPENKLDEEIFCEYLASRICGSEEKTPKFFRFTTTDGEGIYQAVKKTIFSKFSDTEVAKATWKSFINSKSVSWLKRPDNYPEGTRSWFTENGKDKFEKLVMPEVVKFIPRSKIKKIITKSPGNIVYKDEYQIFVKETK